MVNILLIDKRVHNYDYIYNSINNDIARYVLFDFYQDTIDNWLMVSKITHKCSKVE